jgi:hypothetical protein
MSGSALIAAAEKQLLADSQDELDGLLGRCQRKDLQLGEAMALIAILRQVVARVEAPRPVLTLHRGGEKC